MKLALRKIAVFHTATHGDYAGVERRFIPDCDVNGRYFVYDGGNTNDDLLTMLPTTLADLWDLMGLGFGVRMTAQDERADSSILKIDEGQKRVELVYDK